MCYYFRIILNPFCNWLFPKLCWHNRCMPSPIPMNDHWNVQYSSIYTWLTTCAPCTWYGMFFISLAYMHACGCKIDDIKALVQRTCDALDICMIICMSTCACQLHTCQTCFAYTLMCIWIVSQGWRYEVYECTLVLRHDCDPHHDTRCKCQ